MNYTEALKLQWSHVFSDMVRKAMSWKVYIVAWLQWSHVFSDMVRLYVSHERAYDRGSFNGAMSFQTW